MRSLGTDGGGAYILRSISNLSLRRFAKAAGGARGMFRSKRCRCMIIITVMHRATSTKPLTPRIS
jgi:hypothetical protein